MYEEEKPEEPGAPPPAEGAAVPEYSESTEGMAGGSWWETMSLSVCGKQLSTDQAQKAIYALGALVVVLIIVVVATAGGTTVVQQAPPGGALPEDDHVSAGTYSDPGRFVAGTETMSWADAKSYCESNSMTLASVHNRAEVVQAFYACAAGISGTIGFGANSHIGRTEDGNCWIGLHDQPGEDGGTQGGFQWSDGTAVDYLNVTIVILS